MIFYSHLWDFVLKVLLFVALIALMIGLHLDQSIGLLPMIVLFTILFIVIYRQLLSTVAAWLYARTSLRTSLSLAEARQLARLVQLDLSGKWIPLKHVKKLPADQRHEAVMAAVATITPKRRAMLV